MDFSPLAYGGKTTKENIVLSNTTSSTFIKKLFPSAININLGGTQNGTGIQTIYTIPQDKVFILVHANLQGTMNFNANCVGYIAGSDGITTQSFCTIANAATATNLPFSESQSFAPTQTIIYFFGTYFQLVNNTAISVTGIINGFEIDKYEWDNYVYKSN